MTPVQGRGAEGIESVINVPGFHPLCLCNETSLETRKDRVKGGSKMVSQMCLHTEPLTPWGQKLLHWDLALCVFSYPL